MDNTVSNRLRIIQIADLLSQAASRLETLEGEAGEDDGLHEAYEQAYGAMCNLYNRALDMKNAKREEDLGSLVNDPDAVFDWNKKNQV